MLTLDCFKAGKGDSFFLQWGEQARHNILIDSGIEGTYRFISNKIKEAKKIDSIVVSHIDYDHIGGFFKLLDDTSSKFEDSFIVYINTPNLLLCPDGSDLVGLNHGIDFENSLVEKGINFTPLFTGLYPDNKLFINGLELQIITPNVVVINKLISKWTSSAIYQENQKQKALVEDKVSPMSFNLKSAEEILKSPPKPKQWEKDLINSSSISFLASYCGSRILFLADANPILVCLELESSGIKKTSPLALDLMKISHHGSKHNTTRDLLERFSCSNFYISTDSSGPYYHPDRETIILISEYSRLDKTTRLNIYSNYDLKLFNLLTDDEQHNLNIHFQQIDHLEFPLYE